jgi:hypothetical protein
METPEKVDVKKFAQGFVTPASWWKAVGIGLKILALVLVAFAIYKAFIMKPKPTQDITVQSGGTVTIKNEANKRHLILFAEPYVFAEGGNTSRTGVGVKAGVRLEF